MHMEQNIKETVLYRQKKGILLQINILSVIKE